MCFRLNSMLVYARCLGKSLLALELKLGSYAVRLLYFESHLNSPCSRKAYKSTKIYSYIQHIRTLDNL